MTPSAASVGADPVEPGDEVWIQQIGQEERRGKVLEVRCGPAPLLVIRTVPTI
jgi:hypothetical protein